MSHASRSRVSSRPDAGPAGRPHAHLGERAGEDLKRWPVLARLARDDERGVERTEGDPVGGTRGH